MGFLRNNSVIKRRTVVFVVWEKTDGQEQRFTGGRFLFRCSLCRMTVLWNKTDGHVLETVVVYKRPA